MKDRIINLFSRIAYLFLMKVLAVLPPRLVGYIMGAFLPRKLNLNNSNSDNFIFVISSGALEKDLYELQKIRHLNYIVYDQYWFSLFLGIYFRKYPNFCNHFYGMQPINDDDLRIAVAEFKQALEAMIIALGKKNIVIKQFLLPSIDQGGVRVLAEFAEKNHIKTIFFYYEHYTMPVTRNGIIHCYEHYKFQTAPGKILVWHEYAKQTLVKTNVSNADNIVVSGPPRFERWHQELNKSTPKKFITLLSFPGAEYWAPFTYTDILFIYHKLSKKYQDYRFVVKCKDHFHINETKRVLAGNIDNLEITSNIDMIDLLSQSKVITGFNSLSFLESLLAQAHLLLPYWGDSKHDPYLLQVNPQDPDVNAIIDVANSREHFEELLEKRIIGQDYQNDMKKRIEYLNKYIYFNENNKSVDIFEKVFLESYG